jgi:hypothetical protein
MCPRDTETGPSLRIPSELERRAEIDMRVGAALAKREVERYQYRQGFFDGLTLVVIAITIIVMFWPEIKLATKDGK